MTHRYCLRLLAVLACALTYSACDSDSDEPQGSAGKGATSASGAAAGEGGSASGGKPAASGGSAEAGAGGAGGEPSQPKPSMFALGSVVIGDLDRRTTYLQVVESLEDGPFDNSRAIEAPGNGVLMAHGADVFLGLAEEPTWVRYTASADGKLEETGRLSLLAYGIPGVDYGNTIVSDELAVSVLSGPAVAVVWNIKTMEIEREIELPHLTVEGYSLENWTTVAHDGRVYVPGRWADWENGRIRGGVSTTILDPVAGEIVGIAEDDRCASGGRVVFDPKGYAYVMGDGRTYSLQMFANAAGETAPENCLLRIAPGETDFESDFFYTIPSLTGGPEAIGELETPWQGSGIGFVKMFHADHLPEGVEPIDFGFWDVPTHKMWRLALGDEPVATEVEGLPFSAVGFEGAAVGGMYYTGESVDSGATSDIYEIDPATNGGRFLFKMDGYFNGLYGLVLP